MSISRYLCIILAAFVALFGYTGHRTRKALDAARLELAAAQAVNEENARTIARLERSMEITDQIMAGWNQDRTTLAGVRNATRQAIREAMRDETFKAWGALSAPDTAWRLLRQSTNPGNPDTNNRVDSTSGASGGLPGNAGAGKRDQ